MFGSTKSDFGFAKSKQFISNIVEAPPKSLIFRQETIRFNKFTHIQYTAFGRNFPARQGAYEKVGRSAPQLASTQQDSKGNVIVRTLSVQVTVQNLINSVTLRISFPTSGASGLVFQV
jgi:hypothetical protein